MTEIVAYYKITEFAIVLEPTYAKIFRALHFNNVKR